MASYSSITKMVEFWKLFSVSILVIEVKKAISRLDIKWSGKNGAAKMERQIFFVIKKILVLNLEGIQIKKNRKSTIRIERQKWSGKYFLFNLKGKIHLTIFVIELKKAKFTNFVYIFFLEGIQIKKKRKSTIRIERQKLFFTISKIPCVEFGRDPTRKNSKRQF